MARTLLQEKLELQHGKAIEDLLKATLEAHRGQKGLPYLVAADIGISDGTLYWWCREFAIDIDEYRRPSATSTEER